MRIILFYIFALNLSVLAIEPVGIERMDRFDLLPGLFTGTQAKQVSSRDRSGANDDGFNSNYSHLYKEANGEIVLLDEKVPGCIYRIWTTHHELTQDLILRFYFNGESSPRLETSLYDFYGGTVYPYLNPLVGNTFYSSGGFYNYIPVPYSEGLKITLSEERQVAFYYNITYHRFDDGQNVDTWTGNIDVTNINQIASNPGTDPKTTNGNIQVTNTISIANGASVSIFTNTGAGVVQSIKFDFGSTSISQISDLDIVMNWDGGDVEVDAPLTEFFSYINGGIDTRSLPIGMNSSGSCYCFFPMPFWESAEISIINNGGTTISDLSYEIQTTSNLFDRAKTGYFHTQRRQKSFGNDGKDYVFLDTTGRGHFVGTSIFMDPAGSGLSYLEGDERIYIDGSLTPAIYGTGAEDYFNCGWYYAFGPVSLPYHGCTYKSGGSTLAYRFHITDAIPFSKSIKAGIEHGSGNHAGGTFTSIAYYYLAGDQPSGMTLITDLDQNDEWSESIYNYLLPSGTSAADTWKYEGDNDNISIEDQGYDFNGVTNEFTIAIPADSIGLLLRRRTDQGVSGQQALVYVDDIYAGTWYEPDHNFTSVDKRWLDSEFMISSNFVAEKTSVRININPLSTSPLWNEYRYWVYSINPFIESIDSDDDLLPDDWELDNTINLGTMNEATDSDLDGLTDYFEYIAGTEPTNPAAFFDMQTDWTVKTEFGRLYQLEKSSNLQSNDWQIIRADIPGNGDIMELPINTTNSSAFYRVNVEKQ